MNTTTELDTKSSLIKVSRRLFSKAGFDQVSVRMICQEVGCNVSSISYHFGGKEALYRACLEANGQGVHTITMQILQNPQSREDFESKLRLFLERFYGHLCENADAVGMMVYELRAAQPLANDIIEKYYMDVPRKIEKFLNEAKAKGIIDVSIDTNLVSDLMLSKAFNAIFFEDLKRKMDGTCIHENSVRTNIVEQTMRIFTGGIYA